MSWNTDMHGLEQDPRPAGMPKVSEPLKHLKPTHDSMNPFSIAALPFQWAGLVLWVTTHTKALYQCSAPRSSGARWQRARAS